MSRVRDIEYRKALKEAKRKKRAAIAKRHNLAARWKNQSAARAERWKEQQRFRWIWFRW